MPRRKSRWIVATGVAWLAALTVGVHTSPGLSTEYRTNATAPAPDAADLSCPDGDIPPSSSRRHPRSHVNRSDVTPWAIATPALVPAPISPAALPALIPVFEETVTVAAPLAPEETDSPARPADRQQGETLNQPPVPPAAIPAPPTAPAIGRAVRRVVENPEENPPAAVAPMLDIAADPPAPSPVQPSTTPAPTMTGWTSFVIKKTVEEIAQATRNEPPRVIPKVVLPTPHSTLQLTTGISHLATADWGAVVSGTGQLFGREAEISGFLTAGPMGLLPRTGRVSLVDQEKQTQIEAGTLFSDLHGTGYGARYSWRLNRSQPSIAVWSHAKHSRTPTAISYRQQFELGHGVQVGGEIASNGSVFGLARYSKWRVETDVYYRHRQEWKAGEAGVSGTVNLWRGVTASAAVSQSDALDNANTWQLARLRIPLPGATSVAFEQSRWIAETDRSTSALVVQVPFKRVQFMQRIQLGHTEYLQQGLPRSFDAGQSKSAASYVPGTWGSFSFQQASQWFENDRVRQWDEMSMMVKLGRHTSLQATTALPDLLNEQRLRALVKHELDHRMSLEFQYGMLSAFQLTLNSTRDESPTFMVTLNKTWGVRTAARGGSVRGVVVDQAGHAVPEVPVKLGPYLTVTDTNGRYNFTRVPSGEFELSLDKEKLPVSYAVEDKGRKVRITASTETESNFEVMPLNAIRGHVYIDRNKNNAFDAGEGVEGIPVRIGTWVTATERSGAFAFYNQPPGSYVIALDLAHLPDNLVPASDSDLDIELPVDRPLVGLEFKVQTKQRPVVMQTLP